MEDEMQGEGCVWESDVVFIPLGRGGVAYVHLVTEAATGRVLGWKVADTLDGSHSLTAFRAAWRGTSTAHRPSHLRFLRGLQHLHPYFTALLRRLGIRLTLSEPYNVGDKKCDGLTKRDNVGKDTKEKETVGDVLIERGNVGDRLKKICMEAAGESSPMTELSDVYFAFAAALRTFPHALVAQCPNP